MSGNGDMGERCARAVLSLANSVARTPCTLKGGCADPSSLVASARDSMDGLDPLELLRGGDVKASAIAFGLACMGEGEHAATVVDIVAGAYGLGSLGRAIKGNPGIAADYPMAKRLLQGHAIAEMAWFGDLADTELPNGVLARAESSGDERAYVLWVDPMDEGRFGRDHHEAFGSAVATCLGVAICLHDEVGGHLLVQPGFVFDAAGDREGLAVTIHNLESFEDVTATWDPSGWEDSLRGLLGPDGMPNEEFCREHDRHVAREFSSLAASVWGTPAKAAEAIDGSARRLMAELGVNDVRAHALDDGGGLDAAIDRWQGSIRGPVHGICEAMAGMAAGGRGPEAVPSAAEVMGSVGGRAGEAAEGRHGAGIHK